MIDEELQLGTLSPRNDGNNTSVQLGDMSEDVAGAHVKKSSDVPNQQMQTIEVNGQRYSKANHLDTTPTLPDQKPPSQNQSFLNPFNQSKDTTTPDLAKKPKN